jgi:hypothetical protein
LGARIWGVALASLIFLDVFWPDAKQTPDADGAQVAALDQVVDMLT